MATYNEINQAIGIHFFATCAGCINSYQILRVLADKGFLLAQYCLGQCFRLNHTPFSKNLTIALKWYELASKQGCVKSEEAIKLIKKEQEGTTKVLNKGEYLYKYCAFSKRTKDIKYGNKISFSLGENFNDPFDALGAYWLSMPEDISIGSSGSKKLTREADPVINDLFRKYPSLNEEETQKYNEYIKLFKAGEEKVITLFRNFFNIYMRLCEPNTQPVNKMKNYSKLNKIIQRMVKEIKEEVEKDGKSIIDPFFGVETVEDYIKREPNQPRNFFIEVIIGFYFREDCINKDKYNPKQRYSLKMFFLYYFFRKRTYLLCLESEIRNNVKHSEAGCSPEMWGYYASIKISNKNG